MQYTYKAKNDAGRTVSGIIEAENEAQATDKLAKNKIYVLDIKSGQKTSFKNITFKKKVSLKDKIIFTRQLSMMIKGGLPLVECLAALQEQTENLQLVEALKQIGADVSGGMALSKALSKYPKIFPELYISITASGEKSGKLDESLIRLADQLQKDYDLMSKIKTATTYPLVIVIALVGMMILMLTFVVPKLQTIFTEMGVQLPLITRIILGLSDFTVKYWYVNIAIIVGLVFGVRYWGSTLKGGIAIDRFKVKVPIFGVLAQKIYIARFARTTATLVASGLPMLEILATVKEVIGNRYYKPYFNNISSDVESGLTLSAALKKQHIFPVMIPQLISVGERSGKVDEILMQIADFYDNEVEASTASLASMIEPILIILIGAGIGVAIASVILPIYSLVNVI